MSIEKILPMIIEEWMTPNLQENLLKSEIFARGLQNPKCVAALQLMQTDAKEAEKVV